MKIRKYANDFLRKILIGMVVDDSICGKIASKWNEVVFENDWAKQVGEFCVQYFEKYGHAPGKNIENIFLSWSTSKRNPALVEGIESFLAGLSKEYSEQNLNSQFILDRAGDYFKEQHAKQTIAKASGLLDRNRVTEALEALENFQQVEIGEGEGIDLFENEFEIEDTFNNPKDVLISFSGELQKFFGNSMHRDALVSFMGPDKSGKTFFLWELGLKALKQRRRVAFFQVGDLSLGQMKERILTRICGWPIYNDKNEWPMSVNYPTRFEPSEDPKIDVPRVISKEKEFAHPLNSKIAIEKIRKFKKKFIRSDKSYFRISVHPNTSINVRGIESIMDRWATKDKWIPDVVIIDYADILAPPAGTSAQDERAQINATWKQLRKLSQTKHCLVLTATQTDAAAYEKKIIDRRNFNGDKRINAHANALIGINMTGVEKERGMCRLNWVQRRDSKFSSYRCLTLATCLPIGKMFCLASMEKF